VPDTEVVKEAADAVLAANGLTEARLRITLTGGPSPLGSERGAAEPTVVISAMPLAPVPETVAVATVEWPRNERGALAGLKTISYAENVRALAVAAGRGAAEAIFANTKGELCEGTGTNVFLVSGSRLLTPPPDSGCLLGVTRALVLVVAERIGVEAAEETMPLGALAEADEAFLSSTTREVQAIATVDGTPLPPAPGPVTKRLAKAFSELVAEDMDP
jgi:branched-chain amino acid aminotransferase